MNCTNCNALLETNAKFCGECGHPVPETADHQTSEIQCTNCGAVIEPGFQFCGECGHPTSSETPPSIPIDSEAAVLEEAPPPAPPTPPTAEPKPVSPSPPPRVPPAVEPAPSSATPAVMAQDVSPPPQRPAAPPPSAAAQQPVYQGQPQDPPKKRSSGCTIILILLALAVICCVSTMAIGWYAINNMDFDYSSTGSDIPFLEQLQEEGFPFLDQFLGEETPDEIFNDFFGSQTSLILQNSSDLPVCSLYITPTESDYWGDDWLGEDEFIFPGDTKTFQLEPNQFVDISALDCEEFLIYEQYEIDLSSEDVVITLEPAP